jgi:hypothetical protein
MIEILKYIIATLLLLLAGYIFAIGCVRVWFPKSWLKQGDIYWGKNKNDKF